MPIFLEWTFFWNKIWKYLLEIDCIEFEVEVDFGSEDFVGLVDSGTAGDDVIFCESQDGVVGR